MYRISMFFVCRPLKSILPPDIFEIRYPLANCELDYGKLYSGFPPQHPQIFHKAVFLTDIQVLLVQNRQALEKMVSLENPLGCITKLIFKRLIRLIDARITCNYICKFLKHSK